MNNLLSILGSQQASLDRVLRTLVEDGGPTAKVGIRDKAGANLRPAPDKGAGVWNAPCRRRSAPGLRDASARAGPDAVVGLSRRLEQMMDPKIAAPLPNGGDRRR